MASSPHLSEPRLVLPESVARRDKSRIWWAVALLVAGLLYMAYRMLGQSASPRELYRTEAVAHRNIQRTTEAVGTLDVTQRVVVPATTDGQLVAILVEQGQEVSAGQPLARLDAQAAQRDVQTATTTLGGSAARVEQARAGLAAATEERQRTERLLERGLASESASEMARAGEAQARALVRAAEAERQLSQQGLKGAQAKQRLATLDAPVAGFVLTATDDLGAMVGPRSPPLFVITAPITRLRLTVPIPEADVSAIRAGQSAEFSVPAYPGRTFRAEVQKLDVEPQREGSAVSYRVTLDVDNPERLLLPGMTANVKIELAHAENVLAVREAALRFAPSDAPAAPPRSRVWRATGGSELEAVNVVAGVSDGAYTQITPQPEAALSETDPVVIGLVVGGRGGSGGPGISLGKKQ
jgi:HlyD family secretion protein